MDSRWPAGGTCGNAPSPRYVLLCCVVALHAVLFWMLSTVLRPSATVTTTPELEVSVFNPHIAPAGPPAPPLSWMFQMPEEVVVQEPEIAITSGEAVNSGAAASATGRRLAPMLDPAHRNERPELPGTFGTLIAAMSMKLRILVLPDGSVFDAKVLRSTGEAEIDRVAIAWVRENWRYLPAVTGGRPISSWTTVIVRFAPIH